MSRDNDRRVDGRDADGRAFHHSFTLFTAAAEEAADQFPIAHREKGSSEASEHLVREDNPELIDGRVKLHGENFQDHIG